MSEPANLSDIYFRVIHLTKGANAEKMILVIAVGKNTAGKNAAWADKNSYYSVEHENPIIRKALRDMSMRETPFYEAVEAIRNEWLNPDGTWALTGNENTAK